ncbi:hypothetical protein [Aquipseudomonas alcaligenes]|uniref:hypothetical protein n=1 Tax=Aquipseudomonas alcaligenes TaxID=43263 RepID=UPI00374962CF
MRVVRLLLIGCALALSLSARAQESLALELLQLDACRSVGSFLRLRGEGLQAEHLERVRRDSAQLQADFESLPEAQRGQLREPYGRLLASLDEGLSFGPAEEDVPWRYPEQLSRALVDLLKGAEALDGGVEDSPLMVATKLELLSAQYAAQAYLGYFEATPGADVSYLSRSEQQLLGELDAAMATLLPQLAARADDQGRRAGADWRYLRMALGDFDRTGRARLGRSGRPLAPLMVGRHARGMSERLQTLVLAAR